MKSKNLFSYYSEYGICCIPIQKKSKKPLIPWKSYIEKAPSDSLLENWDKLSSGIAIVLGKISNIVAIDIDDLKYAELVPNSPAVKIGNRGETRFFKYNGEPNRNYNGLEIKSTGTYTIIPPSIHPEGMNYVWTRGDLTVDLPDLPKDLIANLDKAFSYTKKDKEAQDECLGVYLPDVEDALNIIPPDQLTYEEWIKLGMGLKTTFGNTGFNIWNEWSKKDKRYKAKEMPIKWQSFTLNEVTARTIFHYADKFGFVINIPEFIELAPTSVNEAPKLPIDDILDTAPCIVQDITNWILSGARTPCKEVALSATIALLSAHKLFKVKTETGLKTNLYVLCVAGSGIGKTQALNAINKFFEFTDNIKGSISGAPVSDAALSRVLTERKKIILWDEIGLCLQSLKNMSSYQTRVFDMMTQIYTMSDVEFVGNEYANSDGKRPTMTVSKPQISCFATTTYAPFFDSLKSSEITSGKYQRWLPFLCPDSLKLDKLGDGNLIMTPEIKQCFNYLKKEFPSPFEKGSLSQAMGNYKDKLVPFAPDARKWIEDKSLEIFNGMIGKSELERSFDARIMERTQQVALVVNPDAKMITLDVVLWSYALVKILLKTFLERGIGEHYAENQQENDSKKLLNYVKNKQRWVTLSEITGKFRQIERNKRSNLLADLVDSGDMECKNQGRGKIYRCR